MQIRKSDLKTWHYLLVFLCLFLETVFAWRPYSRFFPGAEANGIGNAFVGDASSELAAHYNPAGLAQLNKGFTLNYEVYTSVIINDLLAAPPDLTFDTFPFFSLFYRANQWRFSLGLATQFSSYGPNSLFTRSLKFSAAFPLLDNLSIGAGIGPVFLFEGDGRAFSWDFNLGILWRISPVLQWGTSFHSGFHVLWQSSILGSHLEEVYPWILESGISWKTGRYSFLYFGLDYIHLDAITYTLDAILDNPTFSNSLLHRLHPHLGFRFLEPRTGAHLSAGFMTDSDYYDNGAVTQYLLDLGIRFYGKRAVFNAALVDSLLLALFIPSNNHEEKFYFSVSVELN